MDEETLRRATEPFFTTKGQGHGTGLGLSMVDGLVAQSGGAMRISSRPNFGTNVELLLPIADAMAEAPAKPPAVPSERSSTRSLQVLIVDDDANVAAGTAAMIEDMGHAAAAAPSAAAALDILRRRPDIDFVIADYVLEDTTGTELADKIRVLRPGLPVIIATGYASANEAILRFRRLDKPYRQHELAAVIAELAGGTA
jgi:CheY-like chemotaxis protein